MPYQVDIQQIAAQPTAIVRLRASLPELSVVIPRACGEVWTFVRSANVPQPGRHLALYLDAVMNIECGVEVAQPFTGNARVFCSSLPAGTVAITVHWGPYHLLGNAHDAVRAWCAQQGHTLAGPCWEIYGHWNDDPAKVRTDVCYLLQVPPGPSGGDPS